MRSMVEGYSALPRRNLWKPPTRSPLPLHHPAGGPPPHQTMRRNTLAAIDHDRGYRGLQILHHVPGRKANHSNSPFLQPAVPPCIALRAVSHSMALAIHLHSKLRCRTVEIERVGIERMLEAELEAAGPLPQHLPEQSLRQRETSPQRSGPQNGFVAVGPSHLSTGAALRFGARPRGRGGIFLSGEGAVAIAVGAGELLDCADRPFVKREASVAVGV